MSLKNPLISIITVVYNDVKSLELTINSVTDQSYKNIEYIIIDGGSTDGTLDIIKKYEKCIKHWISEPDQGVYDAMNKGLKFVNGDWVYFLGSGDILNNVLERVSASLASSNTIYYGNVFRKDLQAVYDGYFSASKFAIVNICHQAIFYPAKVFEKHEYNLKYKMQADHALNMTLYGNKAFNFKFIPEVICVYEGGGYSAINPDFPFFKDKMSIIRKNFSFQIYAYALIRRYIAILLKGSKKYKK